MKTILATALGLVLLATSSAASAATVDVYLRADAFTIPANTFGNAAPIYMWGLAQTDATFLAPLTAVATVPGPQLTATEGDTLNIHLKNNLPATPADYSEPISLVIAGQAPTLPPGSFPTWDDGTTGNRANTTQRVRSFTTETASGAVTVYTFANLTAGTYLYSSGTHPAVQQQMGLYGSLRVLPATAGRAYADPTSAFDSEVTLLFSEIDPALHAAIATNHYGPTPPDPRPADWMTSTIDYHPKFFLINGAPYQATSTPIPAGAAGKKLLVRFLNAGLETKVAVVQGPYLCIVGEDGHFITVTDATNHVIPAQRLQYSAYLPAGKTIDALVRTPAAATRIPVYDRRFNLTNAGSATTGGMLTYLQTH